MAGRFKLLTDEHWSKSHIKAVSLGQQRCAGLYHRTRNDESPLLQRAFEFADDLNAEIVQALSPRLVVVPFSLGRNRRLIGRSMCNPLPAKETR